MSTKKICTQCGDEYGADQRFCPNDGSPLRAVGGDDPLIGQVLADRYQILEVLGEGGMGRVYLAEHVRMGRRSAVKVISPSQAMSPEAISRFNREAANASRINHPNVAQIYDFGETPDGTLYLAMEFIEGETLTTIIEREGAIPMAHAALIGKQIADALSAAHHLGIVHRDLKPDNIMVARHVDGSDWVKVVDFGIAKTMQGNSGGAPSQTVTTAGVSLGTPEYMSPEQLAGERLDARTDIYSLGLVLFNMLTADLPYPRVTSKETLIRRLTLPPRTLAEVRPDIAWPSALQVALSRALAPEVDDRFATVTELGQAITGATADQVDSGKTVRISPARALVVARQQAVVAGPGQTLPLPGSKRKPWFTIGVVAGVLVIAGVAFALVQRNWAIRIGGARGAHAPLVVATSDTSRGLADSLPESSALAPTDTQKVPAHQAAATTQADAAPLKGPSSRVTSTVAKAESVVAPKPAIDTAPKAAGATATPVSPAPTADSGTAGALAAATRGTRGNRRGGGPGLGRGSGRGPQALQGEHPWAMVPRDSASAGVSARVGDSLRVASATVEINQHLDSLLTLVKNARIGMAQTMLRDVNEDIRLVTTIFGDVPGTVAIRTSVYQRQLQLINACNETYATRPAAFPVTFTTCKALFRSLAVGRTGGPR